LKSKDNLDIKLAEIDENYIRIENSVLERCEFLLERKNVYEKTFPETKLGGLPGKSGGGKKAKRAESVSFVKDTAKRSGKSETFIKEEIRIANKLSNNSKSKIVKIGLENSKTDLLELAKLDKHKQYKVLNIMERTKAKSVLSVVNGMDELKKHRTKKDIKRNIWNDLDKVKGRYGTIVFSRIPWHDWRHTGNILDEMVDKFKLLMQSYAHIYMYSSNPYLLETVEFFKLFELEYIGTRGVD
jgi:hypothetical protein